MNHLAWRVQVATLWLLQVVNFVSIIFISYFETGSIADNAPQDSGLLLTIYFLIFAVLIWLPFVLRPSIGRWIHIVLGALTILLKAGYIVEAFSGAYSMAFLINETWGAVAAGLLVWVAWRVPKAET